VVLVSFDLGGNRIRFHHTGGGGGGGGIGMMCLGRMCLEGQTFLLFRLSGLVNISP